MGQRSHVLLIGGRSGVGKTSSALALHERLRELEVQHALIEGDNLDQAWPAPHETFPGPDLAMRNLAVMWGNYRELGYRRLIYTNTVSVVTRADIVAAMGDDPLVTGVLLRAGPVTAERRLGRRERGESLRRHVERSAAAARELDGTAADDVNRIDTDDLAPHEVADRVLDLVGWAPPQLGRSLL